MKKRESAQDKDFREELDNLKNRLKTQEELRLNLMNEKDRLDMELRDMRERYNRDI